ncbi:MAG TPA: T9SS type A sorting domain-containing protein [Chitinophagales bacterium]|nr:T9SS type A sorting domain-containing protein [Chitinophagales bacterium]
MKKIIFTLLAFTGLYLQSNAQYCGTHGGDASGPNVCVPADTATKPGLAPLPDSLPPVVNGISQSTVIQFENFDTIRFNGILLTINNLTVDSIENLPTGLCWATNVTNNTFPNKGYGCIKVSGTPCSTPGQYKLYIIVTADVGVAIPTNADAAGLAYYVRCINNGDSPTAVDTTQTAANPFIQYGSETANGCGNAINNVDNGISAMAVSPNPFNTQAQVSFYSDKAQRVTERLTDILGNQIYANDIQVTPGMNNHTIERGSLPAGIYFYSVTAGKVAVTKRVVITE